MVRANVFARDGTVIWSSTPGFTGRSLGPNRELEEALEGELAIESGVVGVEDKPEHVAFAAQPGLRFVETYVPIWARTVAGWSRWSRSTASRGRCSPPSTPGTA